MNGHLLIATGLVTPKSIRTKMSLEAMVEDGKSETPALHTLIVLVTSGQAEQKPRSNPAVRKLQWNDWGLDDTENRLAQPNDQNVHVVVQVHGA